MAYATNPVVHFMTRKLPPFPRLCALCHLDLKFRCMRQVVGSHSKAARCHLLDCRSFPVSVCLFFIPHLILSTFARITFGAYSVHGDCQGSMCFVGDGTEGHRACSESSHDLFFGLNLLQGNGDLFFKFKQASQSHCILALLVNF